MRERRRRGKDKEQALAPGQRLDRNKLLQECNDRWGWVRNPVMEASEITTEHVLTVAGLGGLIKTWVCLTPFESTVEEKVAAGEIYITLGDPDVPCERKKCKENPFCLTYLNQEKWQNELAAREDFRKVRLPRLDPSRSLRVPSLPVGLKNLGATCYCNAFLQVWYQDLEFRAGVYKCELLDPDQDPLASPIFTLQLTFSALQEGIQKVYNPVKLVESLELRTSEQQDAQEFSKLFMSHLDSEFKKQKDPKVKTLISDQFEGKLTYVTVCGNCNNESRRESQFLELEISLAKGECLQDRLKAMCAAEQLTDDNKYFCGYCDSLQTATRHTEITKLPPVLHISILRFVYDIQSGERRKSKLPLRFDPYLRTSQILNTSSRTSMSEPMAIDQTGSEETYELRGVLLHKGPSAYHGHYMAKVFDVSAKQWYLFNDETVTPLRSLHKPAPIATINDDSDDVVEVIEPTSKANKRGKIPKRKRVDSDTEEIVPTQKKDTPIPKSPLVSSDAYMLIYARCENRSVHRSTITEPSPIVPPQRALDITQKENEANTKACEEYEQKQQKVDRDFQKTRAMVMDIYRNWSINFFRHNDPHIIVSRAGIEAWLLQWFNEESATETQGDGSSSTSTSSSTESRGKGKGGMSGLGSPTTSNGKSSPKYKGEIDNSDVVCPHGKLNPLEPQNFKVLNRKTYQKLKDQGFEFKPEFVRDDLCRECVVAEFPERFYHVDHPLTVAGFNRVHHCVTENSGYWISKAWLKDWLLVKPKIHTPYHGDLPPDSGEFGGHVICEHNHLTLNPSSRRRISYEAFHLLKVKFPDWYPPAWNTEVCPTCSAQLNVKKENRVEMRKAAEIEKLQLRRLLEGDVFGRQSLSELKDSGVVINASFVRAWRSWVFKPSEHDRPTMVSSEDLICTHGSLSLDLNNIADFDEELVIITQPEYDIIRQFYNTGPHVNISLLTEISDSGETHETVRTDLDFCAECRQERLINFESTTLTIIQLRSNEKPPASKEEFLLKNLRGIDIDKAVIVTNGKGRKTNGHKQARFNVRQSARIKGNKKRMQYRLGVQKDTTVSDMKLEIYDLSDISTFAQRLFLDGTELREPTKTVGELGIRHKEYLFLQELEENVAIDLLSDGDGEGSEEKTKRKRKEGDAFNGTLLGGSSRKQKKRRSRTSPSNEDEVDQLKDDDDDIPPRTCRHCTYVNGPDMFCCDMCQYPL